MGYYKLNSFNNVYLPGNIGTGIYQGCRYRAIFIHIYRENTVHFVFGKDYILIID